MYQYITHILSKSRPCIFEKFENPEPPPPSPQSSLDFELWTFLFSALIPLPLLDFFHIFNIFCVFTASLKWFELF